MSPAHLCDQCLEPLDEDGRCAKHAFADALDPANPQDASFIAARREMRGRARRPLAWMAYGAMSWLLILLMAAPTTPAPSWNTQIAIPAILMLLWVTTSWALLMGISAVLMKGSRAVWDLVRRDDAEVSEPPPATPEADAMPSLDGLLEAPKPQDDHAQQGNPAAAARARVRKLSR